MADVEPQGGKPDIAAFLAEQGYRVTPQRVAIYDYLAGTDTHPSADDIFHEVKKRFPMVSPATVYKTLELFTRLGLVSELGFGEGASRYDGNPRTHVNLLCVECHRIFDVEEDILAEVERRTVAASGFQILGRRYEYFGVCPRCQHAAPTVARPLGDDHDDA